MAIRGRVNQPVTVQFALFQADGFTRLAGVAAQIQSELWRSDANLDDRELTNLPVVVGELPTPGEYVAVFTPDITDRTYTLILRHPQSSTDIEETIQVWSATPSELADAVDDIGAAVDGYLLGIGGGPWDINQAAQVTVDFRVRRTMGLFNPSQVRRFELLDTDGSTVLQTMEGVNIVNVGLGKYRVTFAAIATVGTRYVKVYFTGEAGQAETSDVLPVQFLDQGGAVVAGIMTIDEFLTEFLAFIVGGDPLQELLLDDDGDQIVPDVFISAALRRQAAYVERYLETTFGTKRYASRPDVGPVPLVSGVDYDIEEDGYPWVNPHSSLAFGKLSLRHVPLVSIQRVRALYGSTLIFDFPVGWFTKQREHGALEMVADIGSVTSFDGASVAVYSLDYYRHRFGALGTIPNFWHIDYTAGLPAVPLDVRAAIGYRAAAEVVALAAMKLNPAAVTSQNVGLDGTSRAQGFGVNQPGGRFARMLMSPSIQEWTSQACLERLRRLVRPSARVL